MGKIEEIERENESKGIIKVTYGCNCLISKVSPRDEKIGHEIKSSKSDYYHL